MRQFKLGMALLISATIYSGSAQAQFSLLNLGKKTKNTGHAGITTNASQSAKPASTPMHLLTIQTKLYDGVAFTETEDSTRFYYGTAIGSGDLGYEKDLLFHLQPQTTNEWMAYQGSTGGMPYATWAIGSYDHFPGDSVTYFMNDGGIFSRSEMTNYRYNTAGYIDRIEYRDEAHPGFSELKLISYDSEGRITSEIFQQWQSGSWVNYIKFIYVYNSEGQLENNVYQIWSSGAWENNASSLYSYGSSGNVTSILDRSWSGAAWTNSSKKTLTYETTGVIQEILYQLWSAGAWENYERYEATANTAGQLNTYTYSTWDAGAWRPESKMEYTYASGVATERIDYSYDAATTSWNTDMKLKYNYAEGLMSGITAYTWDNTGSQWEGLARIIMQRNSAGLPTSLWQESWNAGGFYEIPVGSERYYLTYEETPVSVAATQGTPELQIFPNPAFDYVTISVGNLKATSVQIMDLNGRTVYKTKMPVLGTELMIPVVQLPAGTYVLQVKGDGPSVSQKLIVR